ncbi:MAG: hypothetical protein ACJAYJ_000831 [Saprospiraceae bacterium]
MRNLKHLSDRAGAKVDFGFSRLKTSGDVGESRDGCARYLGGVFAGGTVVFFSKQWKVWYNKDEKMSEEHATKRLFSIKFPTFIFHKKINRHVSKIHPYIAINPPIHHFLPILFLRCRPIVCQRNGRLRRGL